MVRQKEEGRWVKHVKGDRSKGKGTGKQRGGKRTPIKRLRRAKKASEGA